MRIRFTPTARREFLDAITYIRRDNPEAARRFRKRAEKILRRLEQFPESGRHLLEFPDLPHREVIIRPYRFFYRVRRQTVWIVAVWHSAQLVESPEESNTHRG